MALSELKHTEEEVREYGVQSAPDKLVGSAAENKAVFDRLFKNVGMRNFNSLIDALLTGDAAPEIGIRPVSGLQNVETLQAALERFAEMFVDVTQGGVADGAITSAKLAEAAVTESKLQNEAVSSEKLQGRSVTTGKIALLAITTALLADLNVTTDKLAKESVTTEKLAALCVNEEKINANAVTAAKIKNGAVTISKLADDVTPDALGAAAKSTVKSVTLYTGGWSGNKQSVSISGVTENNNLVVAPAAESYIEYAENMVRCISQAFGSLTFQCEDIPNTDLTVNILIVG